MCDAKTGSETRLELTLKSALVPQFSPLLQRGIVLKAQVGLSLRDFLRDELRLSEEYMEKGIQTVFLDGRPVDDLEGVVVDNGASLALSAALPGLLGAIMRRGGFYAPLRSQAARKQIARARVIEEGEVVLKLFNLTVRELGPSLLARGIGIRVREAEDFFRERPDDFWAGCRLAILDGQAFEPVRLRDRVWETGRVYLKLKPEG